MTDKKKDLLKQIAALQSELAKLDPGAAEYETDEEGQVVTDEYGEPFLKPRYPEDASDVVECLNRRNLGLA